MLLGISFHALNYPCKNSIKVSSAKHVAKAVDIYVRWFGNATMEHSPPDTDSSYLLAIRKWPAQSNIHKSRVLCSNTALFTLFSQRKKRNQISSLLCVLQLFKWKTLLWIFLQSFSVLFLLCFQITGIHLGNTRKGKCWKAIDLPGGKLYISFSLPGLFFFFQLGKQHIIRSVKFWNHKIVL